MSPRVAGNVHRAPSRRRGQAPDGYRAPAPGTGIPGTWKRCREFARCLDFPDTGRKGRSGSPFPVPGIPAPWPRREGPAWPGSPEPQPHAASPSSWPSVPSKGRQARTRHPSGPGIPAPAGNSGAGAIFSDTMETFGHPGGPIRN